MTQSNFTQEKKVNLAIVIPAYKPTFLDEALSSIASQTNQSFNVYIGDDNSPHDIYSIVLKYMDQLNIHYVKFNTNLGGEDLVGQWNRCVNLVKEEEWIWLFSDDDVMDSYCVETFYSNLTLYHELDVFHFNVNVINSESVAYQSCSPFPDTLSAIDFFEKRIDYAISSFVVEYIFRKQKFIEQKGFEFFDLAWAADDASWIKFSQDKGIKTMDGVYVYWRLSNENISSITINEKIVLRKYRAVLSYLKWSVAFFDRKNVVINISQYRRFKWLFHNLKGLDKSLSFFVKEAYYGLRELKYTNIVIGKSIVYVICWYLKKRLLISLKTTEM